MKKNVLLSCLLLTSVMISACSEIIPKATVLPSSYLLGGSQLSADSEFNAPHEQPNTIKNKLTYATLVVNPSTAVSGYTSTRMMYSRVPYKLEYFAHSQWVDPPARMLTPLILNTLKAKSLFSSVTLSPSAAKSRYSLDTKIINLQQDFFSPKSTQKFTLWVTLIDNSKHEIILARELNAVVTANSEDAYGGVIAANKAVNVVLEQLAAQCNEALMKRQ